MKRLLFLFLAGAASLNVAAVSEIPVSLNSSQYAVVTNNAGPLRDFTLSGITAYDGAAQVEFSVVSNRPYATATAGTALGAMPAGPYTHQLSTFNAWTGTRTYSYRVQIAQPDGTGDIYARITAVTISREGVNLVDHPDIRNLVRDSALIEFAYTGTDPELAGYSVTSLRLGAVPYIESLGTSGISTGYRMKGGVSRVEVDYALTTVNSGAMRIFGDLDWDENICTMFYFTGTAGTTGGLYTFRIRSHGKNGEMHDVQWSGDEAIAVDTERHTLVTDLKNGRCQIITGDNVKSRNFTNYGTFASDFDGLVATMPLSLFANYGNACATAFNNSGKAKIYGVKIYENYVEGGENTPVHDFVPCKKDGIACFKDLVTGRFITGENAAAFTASDNAPEYQDDGYVSTVSGVGSKMYIDTGVKVTDNTRIELDCSIATNMIGDVEWHIFDCNCNPRFLMIYAASALRYVAGGLAPVSAAKLDASAFPHPTDKKDVRRTLILDNYGGMTAVVTSGFTNKTVTFTHPTTTTSAGNIILGAYHGGGSYNAPLKIYECRIYENGELAHDFVPFVKCDYGAGTATAGLLDNETGTFVPGLDKSGGGNLLTYGGAIAGEDDAYIESNGLDGSGISTGYKMKGAISRVEVDFRFVTPAAQKYIYGSSADATLQTFLYTTGSGVGDSFKFCQRPYSNNGCDRQWVMTPDTERHTAVTDMANRTNILTGVSIAPKSAFASDFSGKTATLPLTIFGKYSSASATAINACPHARIYSVRFYENYVEGGSNTPVRELIPYKNGSVVGFYDTVTGETVKNDNVAAGAFTFGGAGMDHGELNCYVKPGYVTKISYGHSTTLTAYAPGAVSYRWLCDGEPIYGGTDGTLTVSWARGGTRTDDGYLHTYQAIAVFNMYGATRESSPSAAAEIKCRFVGTTITIR